MTDTDGNTNDGNTNDANELAGDPVRDIEGLWRLPEPVNESLENARTALRTAKVTVATQVVIADLAGTSLDPADRAVIDRVLQANNPWTAIGQTAPDLGLLRNYEGGDEARVQAETAVEQIDTIADALEELSRPPDPTDYDALQEAIRSRLADGDELQRTVALAMQTRAGQTVAASPSLLRQQLPELFPTIAFLHARDTGDMMIPLGSTGEPLYSPIDATTIGRRYLELQQRIVANNRAARTEWAAYRVLRYLGGVSNQDPALDHLEALGGVQLSIYPPNSLRALITALEDRPGRDRHLERWAAKTARMRGDAADVADTATQALLDRLSSGADSQAEANAVVATASAFLFADLPLETPGYDAKIAEDIDDLLVNSTFQGWLLDRLPDDRRDEARSRMQTLQSLGDGEDRRSILSDGGLSTQFVLLAAEHDPDSQARANRAVHAAATAIENDWQATQLNARDHTVRLGHAVNEVTPSGGQESVAVAQYASELLNPPIADPLPSGVGAFVPSDSEPFNAMHVAVARLALTTARQDLTDERTPAWLIGRTATARFTRQAELADAERAGRGEVGLTTTFAAALLGREHVDITTLARSGLAAGLAPSFVALGGATAEQSRQVLDERIKRAGIFHDTADLERFTAQLEQARVDAGRIATQQQRAARRLVAELEGVARWDTPGRAPIVPVALVERLRSRIPTDGPLDPTTSDAPARVTAADERQRNEPKTVAALTALEIAHESGQMTAQARLAFHSAGDALGRALQSAPEEHRPEVVATLRRLASQGFTGVTDVSALSQAFRAYGFASVTDDQGRTNWQEPPSDGQPARTDPGPTHLPQSGGGSRGPASGGPPEPGPAGTRRPGDAPLGSSGRRSPGGRHGGGHGVKNAAGEGHDIGSGDARQLEAAPHAPGQKQTAVPGQPSPVGQAALPQATATASTGPRSARPKHDEVEGSAAPTRRPRLFGSGSGPPLASRRTRSAATGAASPSAKGPSQVTASAPRTTTATSPTSRLAALLRGTSTASGATATPTGERSGRPAGEQRSGRPTRATEGRSTETGHRGSAPPTRPALGRTTPGSSTAGPGGTTGAG